MTSAEFVAKYKLFKPIAERGARSFLAQEVEGRRAVLVHRLDIAPPDENRRLLGSLESLRPEERTSVIEVMDVDGVAVVVTRFTPDFHDLPSWLAEREQAGWARPEPQGSATPPSGGFNSAFSGFGLADAPPPLSSGGRSTPAPGSAPGAVRPLAVPPPPSIAPPTATPTPAAGGEFTQLFGTPLGRAPEPPTQAPATPTTPAPGEFAQLFKGFGTTPLVGDASSVEPPRQATAHTPPPSVPPAAWSTPQPPPFAAPSSAPPLPPSAPARGEFTQLFQGLTTPDSSPTGGPHLPPPPAFGAPAAPYTSSPGGLPPLTPPGAGTAPPVMGPPGPPVFGEPPRSPLPPIAPPSPPLMGEGAPSPPPFAASFGSPAAPPSYGGSFGGPPPPLAGSFSAPPAPPLGPASAPPPPLGSGSMFGAPPSARPPFTSAGPPVGGVPGMAPPAGNSAGASEFTRMLGAIAPPRAPAPPPLPVAPPPGPPTAGSGQAGGGSSGGVYLRLSLALNVVLIAAAAVMLHFLLKS